ncbi:MAG: hypothetical protein LBH68_08035 [Bifidobacteriaceae bacterium]|jgi:hypothetical protein|nr:hypothetical protein [Bifidobacteriaceae bacterium]
MKNFKRLALGVSAVLAAALLFTGGATMALWSKGSQQAGAEVTYRPAVVSITVDSGQPQAATAGDLALEVEFTASDAAAIRAASQADVAAGGNGRVLWGRLVELSATTHGTVGMGYSVTMPQGPLLDYAKGLVLYPVAKAVDCPNGPVAESAAPAGISIPPNQSSLGNPAAISTAYKAQATHTEMFCLATTFDLSRITNTATAEVLHNGTSYTASSTWSGLVLPNANSQAPATFVFNIDMLAPKP